MLSIIVASVLDGVLNSSKDYSSYELSLIQARSFDLNFNETLIKFYLSIYFKSPPWYLSDAYESPYILLVDLYNWVQTIDYILIKLWNTW